MVSREIHDSCNRGAAGVMDGGTPYPPLPVTPSWFMARRRSRPCVLVIAASLIACGGVALQPLRAQPPPPEEWEITPESEAAIAKGLAFLAKKQGPAGSWGMNDLGLVATGALAFMAAGHTPGDGEYGPYVERALGFVIANAKPSGLFNINRSKFDMYNHGLATFVLGQAYGMTNDRKVGAALDKALQLIVQTQGPQGGWYYEAKPRDGDLSLCVMQAKALRSATDSGFEIPRKTIEKAIAQVRSMYLPKHKVRNQGEAKMREGPGQFTYNGQRGDTPAMAAAGVVCMQEFGQYEDWRIAKSMERVLDEITKAKRPTRQGSGELVFDAYTLYYVGQALYQVGGQGWKDHYPALRDRIIRGQRPDGGWEGSKVEGLADEVYGTAVAVFVLAIPNRYLPILQEAKVGVLGGR